MGGPFGSTTHASSTRGKHDATPVVLTREIGGGSLTTAQVVLADAEPFAQLLGSDPTRRPGAVVYADPEYPTNVRVFIVGNRSDAANHRNGTPISTGGPIYGLEIDAVGGSIWCYADPASVGTLDANGGLTLYVIQSTGETQPTDISTGAPATEDEDDDAP